MMISDAQTDYFNTRFYDHITVDVKHKFYPDNADVVRSKQFNDEWDKKREERKKVTTEYKGGFKKGDLVYYTASEMKMRIHTADGIKNITIPSKEYEGVITKGSNGMGSYPQYEINYDVPSAIVDEDGSVLTFKNPKNFRATVFTKTADTKLRKRVAQQ